MRSTWAISLAVLAACGGGDDGNTTPNDGGGGGGDSSPAIDAPVDAAPPNTAHRGLAQAARIGDMTNGTISAGFYDVPTDAPGCTWTYDGSCSLQSCETDAGLVAASAGELTFTVDGSATMVSPTGDAYSPSQIANLVDGASVTIAAAGATVPAFTTSALVMPATLTVSAPANNGTIDRTMPLTASWTATSGMVYVNISQTSNGGPYPASYARTIRCDVDAQAGSVAIPTSLLSGLATGMNANLYVAASAAQTLDAGAYEVTGRLLAIDAVRAMTVE